jgi:glycopeptide antibiotics resistance protein
MALFITLHQLFPYAILLLSGFGLLAFMLAPYLGKEPQPMRFGQSFALTGLVIWAVLILFHVYTTTPTEGASDMELHLFSSYTSAWNSWSGEQTCQILYKLLQFFPLGVLLPLAQDQFLTWRRTAFLGLTVAFGLEFLQLSTAHGSFSIDSLFQHFLGCLAGYFITMAVLAVIRREKPVGAVLRALVIPLGFTALFIGALITYHLQEYGNLSIVPSYAQPMPRVTLTLDTELEDTAPTGALYLCDIPQADTITSLLCEELNLTLSPKPKFKNSAWQYSFSDSEGSQSYQLSYRSRSGHWTLSALHADQVAVSGDMDRLRWRWESWLTENGLLSSEATYSLSESGVLSWTSEAPEDLSNYQKDFSAGTIAVTLTRGGLPKSIDSTMLFYHYVKSVELLSPAAAYRQIEQGNFSLDEPLSYGDTLSIVDCTLSYCLDSKGYYQPTYDFSAVINQQEEPVTLTVPALS